MSDSPFSGLTDLPCDVAEALEQFKLAIIRHRSMDWEMFSHVEMKSVCLALTQFVHGDEPIPLVHSQTIYAPSVQSGMDRFQEVLRMYIEDHPESHVRFASKLIKREFDNIWEKGSSNA